jgi:hypothetical protein
VLADQTIMFSPFRDDQTTICARPPAATLVAGPSVGERFPTVAPSNNVTGYQKVS